MRNSFWSLEDFILIDDFITVNVHVTGDKNTKICGAAKINCYKAAEKKLFDETQLLLSQCNCLPSCTSIEYDVKIDQIKYDQEIDGKNNRTEKKNGESSK